MKDIGSIFPLYNSDLEKMASNVTFQVNENTIQYSLCREALLEIAENFPKEKRKVLLPAYTCDTVINPFKQAEWDCIYFPVDKNLRIDTDCVRALYKSTPTSLIVVHPYFGMDLDATELSLLKDLHDNGCMVVVDQTQCLFSKQQVDYVDYYVGSYRKWYEVIDGGYLKSNNNKKTFVQPTIENETFVSLQADSMYLRGLYFETGNEKVKNISRRLNKMAVDMVKQDIIPHTMASSSIVLMNEVDKDRCQKQRFENYYFLFDYLKDIEDIELVCNDLKVVTTAPLYFTFFVKDRKALQNTLAKEHIYAPVIWPLMLEEVLVNDTIKTIYDTILSIPIDQRYDQSDMKKVVETIKHHYYD